MNKESYNMYRLSIKTMGIMLWMVLFFVSVSFAQKVSSDDLLRQALKETNVNKNYPRAIQLAQRALKTSPDYTDIRLLLGRLYMLTGQNTAAEQRFLAVLKKSPKQKDALNYIVNLSYQQKDLPKAIGYASSYLNYYPADKNMQLKKVAMLYESKDYTAANVALSQLLAKYPVDQDVKNQYISSHLNAGNELRKANQLTAAIASYEQVLKANYNNKDALQALYNLNIQQGNEDKALQYATVLERNGDQQIALSKADLLRSMGRYQEALTVAEQLKIQSPDNDKVESLYKDILYSKGKSELNNQDTLSAYQSYTTILEAYPADTFSRNQLTNIAVAQQDRQQAIKYIDEGIAYYNNQEALALKKLSITQAMGNNKNSYHLSHSLTQKYPGNESIRSINDDLFILTRQNRIGFNYGITAFDQTGRKPWNLYSAFYMRTEDNGSLIARVNYADRKEATGYQFEVEAYPTHNKGYSYINLAYANAVIFPKFKFAYSYFLPFEKGWETEFGVRYLNSYFNYLSYTAGVGKYFGNFWLNAKTFVTPNGGNVANAYILSGRYFINNSNDDYITAIAGYGFSPDDRGRNFEITERLNLESVRFTLGYQRTLWKRNLVGIFGTWNNQEYIPGRKRNEFDAQISFQHKF